MSECGLQEEEDEDFILDFILDEPIDMSKCGLQEEGEDEDFILDEPIDDVEDSVDEPIDDVEDSDDEPIEKDFLPDVEDSDDEPDDEPIDDFPANFKEYMERELKYSRLEIFDKPPGSKSRSLYTWEGIRWVFWNPQDDDLTLSSDQSVDFITDVCASRKVRHALHKLILHPELSDSLVQFWARTKTREGRTLLTTKFQPFAIGKLALNSTMHLLCEYRMGMCREYNNYFYADDAESEKEELGFPGRVFLNKLPESTPLVELYTLKEYPQRDLALRCKIKVSWAVPVLEHSSHTCVGVLEFVSRYNNMSMNWFDMIFRGSMYDIFQEFGLLCFDGYKHYKMQNWDKNKVLTAAFQELKMVCESVCKIHYIPLALAWASCPSCNDLLQIQFQLSALDYVYVIDSEDLYFYSDLRVFLDASKFCHLRKRQVTEKILQFPNLLYCSDVKQCSIAEFPLVPYARFCDLSGWFTMCLQSSYTRDELYVLEFFWPESDENDENILTKLRLILGTMEEYFETFKLASGQELGEVLSEEVINFQNYQRSHSTEWIPATGSIPSLELLNDGGVILQQGQLDQPSMDRSSNGQNVVTAERNILVASSSREGKRKMQDREHKKAGVRIEVPLEEILKCSNMKRNSAASKLHVSTSTLKRLCRSYDIRRWPPRNIKNANPFQPSLVENQGQIPQLNSDLPSNQALAGVSHIKPGFQDADMVTIRAKYENNKIKFRLPLSSRFVELQEQVAKKLNLEAGTYCVKYKDEEDEEDGLTLITCDEDLQDCMHASRSPGKASVVVFLELKQPITNLNPGLHGGQHTPFSPLRNQGQTCHFIDQFPEPIRPYIKSVKDVESDGNCGFRAISAFINEDCNEHEWKQVRIDLLRELDANFDLYERVALRSGRAGELRCILNWNESPAPQAKWMTMPDMGHLIASTYNCVLIHLSKLQCLTFLPLQSKPLPSIKRKVIAIGFVNGGHFVQVFLKKGSPMPPIACNWTIYHDSIAKNWDAPYVKAIQKFKEIIGNDVATKEVIDVD